jgi:outer membrane protein
MLFSSIGSLCIASTTLSPVLFAQAPDTSGPKALTLEQVIETADANYPAIKEAKAKQKAAQGGIAVARTAYLPRTDVLWQTDRATANNILGLLLPQSTIPSVTGSVIPPNPTRSAWNSAGGALLSWQPFDFGARGAKVEVAKQGSEAAQQAAALTRLEISTSAGSAFFDLAGSEQLVVAAQANVQRYESFDNAVHVLVDNTLRPGADASQADAQLALARNQLIQTQTQVALKRSALAEYLQFPQANTAIDASEILSALPPSDLQTAVATNHPAILEERALSKQQEAQKRILDRSYVPVFSTSGMVFGRGAGTDASGTFSGGTAGLAPNIFNWGAGIQVSFAAFDYFNIRDQRRVQEANVLAEHARYDQSVSDINAELERAQATLAGARQLAANIPIELSAARASEQQQQARYRSGLATVVDVATAEALLVQAEGDDVIARLGVWRAELGVAAAQGDLQPFLKLLQSRVKGN